MHTIFSGVESITTATDAWFRQYKSFSDALTAAGFPLTADTGQVNWTTVTVPAASTYTAYEIRRFDDADQATWPVFIRIDYAYITSTQQHARIRLTFGTGSDGAGNITGVIGPSLFAMLGSSTTDRDWLFSADESGFALLAGIGGSTIARHFIAVERARDIDGATVPRYLLFYRSNSSTNVTSIPLNSPGLSVFDFTHSTVQESDTLPVLYWRDLSLSTQSLALGTLYPFGVLQFPTLDGMLRSKMFIGCAYVDFADEAILNVPRFSTNVVYPYRLEKKENNSLGGVFGMAPSGAATTQSDNPSTYAMPCIFWD